MLQVFRLVLVDRCLTQFTSAGLLAPPQLGRYEPPDFGEPSGFWASGSFFHNSPGPVLRRAPHWPSYPGSQVPQEKLIPRVRTTRKLQVLTFREARVLRALAETIFPSDGTGMPSIDDAEVVEYFDDLLVHLPFKEKALIRCLVVLLEVQPLAFNGLRPKLFTQATAAERTRNLAGWETSRIFKRRLVFMAIRTLMLWAYADSQEVEKGMGFRPGTRRTEERNQARLSAARRAIAQAGEASTSIGRKISRSLADPSPEADPSVKGSRVRALDSDVSTFEEQA